ncbi:MAG: hypothetical protein Q9208_007855 [Pyrenodesmia sp. 3 TL-2023]
MSVHEARRGYHQSSQSLSDPPIEEEMAQSTPGHAMTTRRRAAATSGPPQTPDHSVFVPPEGPPIPRFIPPTASAKSGSPERSTSESLSRCSSKAIFRKEDLGLLQPQISFNDIEYIKNALTPQLVRDLWAGYIVPARDETRIVPEELKASYAFRSRELISDSMSLGTGGRKTEHAIKD